MTEQQLHDYLLNMPDAWLDYPFGEGTAVYKFGHDNDGKGKIFAIIAEGSKPPRISLKCDPQLAEVLRAKYESVQPGHHLNKKHWNTIVCTGQLKDDELEDLMRHSYLLAAS